MKSINGLEIPASVADLAAPDHMALLVYDMQVGICSQVESAGTKVAIASLLAAARSAGIRVAFTRYSTLSKEWMGVTQFRTAMAWQRKAHPEEVSPWFPRGSAGVEIVPELAPSPGDFVFDRLSMSAFEGTPLRFALADSGIGAIAIAGIAMEVGIEPTVRHAIDLGIIPIIVEDAVGWGNEEAAQRSIAALRFAGDAMFTTVAELADLFSRLKTTGAIPPAA